MAKAQEKEQAKAIEATKCDHQIVEAASSQTYDMPLNSYELKEDLVGLARALQVPKKGTAADLNNCIKAHRRL
jgi:hypothetical protein